MLKRTLLLLGAMILASTLGHARGDVLRVVTTLPDLADLAESIGGAHVEVQAIARPQQNLHAVRIKPSHLVAVSRADVFIQVGLSLEHAWVPGLLESARNRSVSPGGVGFIDAGAGFETINTPVSLDRSQGVDLHPEGNPHINLSFDGGPFMAERILEGLVRVDPAHEEDYRANHARWLLAYGIARERWELVAARVAQRGGTACVYHCEFDYLLRDFGLELVAALEPKPGVPPTPSHLAKVIELLRERKVPVLVTAPWSNNRSVARVADSTGVRSVEIPVMSGGDPRHLTWIGLMNDSVNRLALAYGVDPDSIAVGVSEAGSQESPSRS